MTLERRVSKLEESLSPTQLVLRWLAEAQAYGDIPAYVASLLSQDSPETPLDRLAREAVGVTRTAMRGKRPELVEAAIRSALRETVFRYELVIRLNATTHELLDREGLRATLLASHIALVLSERGGKHPPDEFHLRRLEQCAGLTRLRVNELLAWQEARASIETRYLDGHSALFPDVAAAFGAQLQDSGEIAAMAARAAGLAGLEAEQPDDRDVITLRAGELVADLVEPAKADTLDKLGEGRQALDIAAGWVRSKMVPRAAVAGDQVAERGR